MPNFTGHLKGRTTVQTIICLNDTPEHELILRESSASQSCSDDRFNKAKHTSCGTADLIRGHGRQEGYFMNEDANGDCACGTFECKVATVSGQVVMEGNWKYTHGTGQFTGITGNGTFRGRMTSPTESETSYEGRYELKAETKAA